MATRKRVTIRHVAQEAAVSTQTVSRVINDRPDVAPETRIRVQQVISHLGYQPSALALSLIHQRSHTLGVVATGLEYYGPSHTLIGVEKQIRSLEYSLLLDLLHHPETEDVERIINRMLSRQVDGILWAVPEIGNNRTWLKNKKLHSSAPMIFLSMEPLPDLFTVAIDNRLGGRLAVEHLISQGYRQIGIITGPLDWWEARQRLLGWRQALQAARLPTEDRQIAEGNWSAASGEQAIRKLLAQFPEIEAVFAGNDQMALGVLQAMYKSGRRLPEDLAVVGFDNIPESAYFWPALTTVDQPLIELGCLAVEKLSQIIDADYQLEGKIESESIYLQPELVVRDSTLVRSG